MASLTSAEIQYMKAHTNQTRVLQILAPNITIFGPYNTFASGSYIPAVETQIDCVLQPCSRSQTENIQSSAPKLEAVNDSVAYAEEIMERTSLERKLPIMPGNGLHFKEMLSEVRADDWDIVYKGNRFAWLGNGVSQAESGPNGDLAYYIREHDDGPFFSHKSRLGLLTRSSKK